MLDFSNAESQRDFDLIPDGTVAPMVMTIRPGGSGDGGYLKRSKSGDCMMLDCECVILEGPYAKRKVWTNMTVEGESEGHKKATDISRSRIRAMLESARGINPADESEAAMASRRISAWSDLDGLAFWGVIGIEKGKGDYKDKNTIKAVVTPDRQGWTQLQQAAPSAGRPSAAVTAAAIAKAPAGRPAWAS